MDGIEYHQGFPTYCAYTFDQNLSDKTVQMDYGVIHKGPTT